MKGGVYDFVIDQVKDAAELIELFQNDFESLVHRSEERV
jgi:hypothetical protein